MRLTSSLTIALVEDYGLALLVDDGPIGSERRWLRERGAERGAVVSDAHSVIIATMDSRWGTYLD